MRTHKEFVEEMNIIHPKLKILGNYTNSTTKIPVEDGFGIGYLSMPYSLLAGNYPSISTALNKNSAFKIKLSHIQSKIKILGSYTKSNIKILVEDELGIKYLSKPNDLLNGNPPTIQTALNKTDAFTIKLKLIQPNLTVSGEYINSETKILVQDKLGIYYNILPNDLLRNITPSIQSATNKNLAFKIMSEKIHGTILYNYSIAKYITNKDKVKIICNVCKNIFLQRPTRHLSGDGCPTCGFIKSQSANQKTLKQRAVSIVDDINKKHNNRINCDKLIYNGNKIKSLFGCNINTEHGYWKATPNDILDGCGCPYCNSSKGEIEIETILKNKSINYVKYKTFPDCRYKNLLKFDFYLPDYNICIEYDGIQHFEPVSIFGGDKVFQENKIRDKIKNKFCKNNNIQLLRIPYTKFKEIEKIILFEFYSN